MSAYPSLLSPLMDATGLIATTALNTLAQTALAAGTYASAEVDILKITALQESGGNYLGLPATNITAQGKFVSQPVAQGLAFQSTGFNVNALGKIGCIELTTQTAPGVYGAVDGGIIAGYTRVIAPEFKNTDSSFITDSLGNCTVNELTYTTLNPPIAPGATPSIAQVLAVGEDCNGLSITNATTIQCNEGFFTNTATNSQSVNVLNQIHSSYYNITANASGLDLNTKWTSDGLILHKVSTGSDITIQNDATNLITLGTSTGFADLQVGTLKYTALDPAIPEATIPTLSQVLTAGNIASADIDLADGEYSIVGADQVYADHFRTAGNNLTGLDGSILTLASGVVLGSIQALDNELIINPCAEDLEVGNVNFSNKSISNVKSLVIQDALGSYAQIDSAGAITCGTVNYVSVPFKPTYDYYVSKGGDDNSIYGSILSPFLTIQQAITVCEGEQDGIPRVIHVSAGSYSENLTINKSRISIIGEGVGTHPDIGTSITGTITINIIAGNSDLHNNNITISGFLLVSLVEDSTAGDFPHRLMINNCHIYGNDRCLYMHPAYDYRCFVSNCVISNDSLISTDPLVQCAGLGMVSFNQTQMTAKGASQMVFKLSGTCRIDVFAQNILTSASVGTNVAVAIFNHNSTQTITLGQNAFVYANSGAKRNVESASGVFLNNTGSLVLLMNTFSLSGLASSQMAVYATTLVFPTTIIIYGANISTSNTLALTATGISGSQGTTKVAGQAVQ